MSGQAPKVLIATLWQRTSDKGNEYLSGFLGKARVTGHEAANAGTSSVVTRILLFTGLSCWHHWEGCWA